MTRRWSKEEEDGVKEMKWAKRGRDGEKETKQNRRQNLAMAKITPIQFVGVNPFARFKSRQMTREENIQKAVTTKEMATEVAPPQQGMAVVASCVKDTLPQYSSPDDDLQFHSYAGDVFSCAFSFLPHFLTKLYHFPADLRHFPADLRHSLTGLHHSKTTHPPMK